MRGIRRTTATIGLLTIALLPAVAAVSPTLPRGRASAVTPEPLADPNGDASLAGARSLPETGQILLVGASLFGLATVVRKRSNARPTTSTT